MKYSVSINEEKRGKIIVEANNSKEAVSKIKKIVKNANDPFFNGFEVKSIDLMESKRQLYEFDDEFVMFDEEDKEYDISGRCIDDLAYPADDSNAFEDESDRFVWGIKSYEDMTDGPASMHSMNDIDVIYNKDERRYVLSIEEIYHFEEPYAQVLYLKDLRDKFRKFMESKSYSKEELDDLSSCSIWDEYYPTTIMETFELSAETLLDLYKKFVFFVEAYDAMIRLKLGM